MIIFGYFFLYVLITFKFNSSGGVGYVLTQCKTAKSFSSNKLIAESKEIQALGAFDRHDRSIAMDLLGFKKQLVFATHSVVTPFRDVRGKAKYVDKQGVKITPELRYGATRAHNRAMADFCSQDSRLMGVGVVLYMNLN